MTEEEARIFLGASDVSDDPDDLYETQVFTFRRFFLTSSFVPGLITSRLRKMEKIEEAYRLLTGNIPQKNTHEQPGAPRFSAIMLEAFDRFQALLMPVRLKLSQATDMTELRSAVRNMLILHTGYRLLWPDIPALAEDEVLLGKAPDDMELRAAISEAATRGIVHFADLAWNDAPQLLRKESKRLFLLSKKDTHGRSL